MKYGQSVEIYEDPDNAGQYKTDADEYSVYTYGENINVSSNGDIPIKTFSADEVSELTPYETELLYAHDDVFSYTYDYHNDSWIRRAQYMIFQPGSIDPASITDDKTTWRIFELPEPVVHNGTNLAFIIMDKYNLGFIKMGDINNNQIKNLISGTTGAYIVEFSDNGSTGLWVGDIPLAHIKEAIKQLDEWAKTHTFEETWYTLDEFNAKYGTSYTLEY